MFSFFKKADNVVEVEDFVWMNEQKKMIALANIAKEDASGIFICWFDETRDRLAQVFADNSLAADNIYVAREVVRQPAQHKRVVFVEHHPLQQKEQALYTDLQLTTATIHSSLDEPMLQRFGGERIISLMRSLGTDEGECLQHKLITASIKKAQEKLAKKVVVERSARSQQEWMERNVAKTDKE